MSLKNHTVMISNVITGLDSWYQMSLEDHTVMISNVTTGSHTSSHDIKCLYRIQIWYHMALHDRTAMISNVITGKQLWYQATTLTYSWYQMSLKG